MTLRVRTCLTALAVVCAVGCAVSSDSAQGLSCLSRTPRFDLTPDPAYWTIVLPAGVECTEELRFPPLVIEDVTIITPPRNGRLIIEGSLLRYLPNIESNGPDAFVISVSGSNGRATDSTFIYADVMVQ
jgi:hypothetical protein